RQEPQDAQLRRRVRAPLHDVGPDRQHRPPDEVLPGVGRRRGAVHQQRGGQQTADVQVPRAVSLPRVTRTVVEAPMTEDDFQRALRREPDNLALRMAYADWLKESGDPRGQFLDALQQRPADVELRLVFADYLQDQGDPSGELLGLTHQL